MWMLKKSVPSHAGKGYSKWRSQVMVRLRAWRPHTHLLYIACLSMHEQGSRILHRMGMKGGTPAAGRQL
jgi:hypothetical protein